MQLNKQEQRKQQQLNKQELKEKCKNKREKILKGTAEDCKNFIGKVVDEYDALDHLVASAGQSMWARFEDVEDLSLYRRLLEVNFLGVVNCIHPALAALRKSQGQLVVISSIQAKVGVPYHSGYGAS